MIILAELSYKGYSAARDASWQTLTENNIGDLPVDVFKLAQDMGIKVVPYSKSRSLMMLLGLARHMQIMTDFMSAFWVKVTYFMMTMYPVRGA